MIGSLWKYKEQEIETWNEDYKVLLADNLSPRGLESWDETQDRQRYHWVITSATFARWRTIPIEGFITSDTKIGFWKATTYLDRLFALQTNPSKLELQEFKFTDDELNTWVAWAKIKKPIEYTLYDDDSYHFVRKFRVVLYCPDPNFYSENILKVEWGTTWFSNGVSLPEEGLAIPSEGLDLSEGSDDNLVGIWWDIDLWGNQIFEPKFIITILKETEEFLKIKNNTSWDFIRFDLDFQIGDKIVIDNQQETATRNWESIMFAKSFGDFFWVNSTDAIEIYDVTQSYFWEKLEFETYFTATLQ